MKDSLGRVIDWKTETIVKKNGRLFIDIESVSYAQEAKDKRLAEQAVEIAKQNEEIDLQAGKIAVLRTRVALLSKKKHQPS